MNIKFNKDFAIIDDMNKKLIDERDINTVFDVNFWLNIGIPVNEISFTNKKGEPNYIFFKLEDLCDNNDWDFGFKKDIFTYKFCAACPTVDSAFDPFFNEQVIKYISIISNILELKEVVDPFTSEYSLEAKSDSLPF